MKGGSTRTPAKLPVVVGKVLLRWIFTKADLVLFVYRFVVLLIYDVTRLIIHISRFIWYACHLQGRSSMNSSVDFFESLIDDDGRFAELNCQEPVAPRALRPRSRPLNHQDSTK